MRIDTILPQDTLLLETLEFVDAISEPYVLRCRVLCPNPATDVDALLETSIRVTLQTDRQQRRYFHGVVRSIRVAGRVTRFVVYELEASHDFWFLSLNTDCRIWQETTVPNIVRDVFSKYKTVEND